LEAGGDILKCVAVQNILMNFIPTLENQMYLVFVSGGTLTKLGRIFDGKIYEMSLTF